jgi:hypothetical protein
LDLNFEGTPEDGEEPREGDDVGRRKWADPSGPGLNAGRRGVFASTRETMERFSLVGSTALPDAASVDSTVVGSDGARIWGVDVDVDAGRFDAWEAAPRVDTAAANVPYARGSVDENRACRGGFHNTDEWWWNK